MTRWFWVKLATIGVAVAVPWMLTDFWGAGVLVAPFGWLLGRFIELGMKNKDIPELPTVAEPAQRSISEDNNSMFDAFGQPLVYPSPDIADPVYDPAYDAAGIYWDDHGPNVFDPKW